MQLPQSDDSYWLTGTGQPAYPSLSEAIETDVAIVGAGLTGLTAAYLLKQAGLNVAVLEKETVGAGVSGHTTGKITSQHGLIYSKLTKRLGADTARIYGEANQEAISQIARVIKQEAISCDWQPRDNYVFTTDQNKVAEFQQEADIATSYGLPASFVTESELPFAIAGAVKFTDQAHFHVRKYLDGLAQATNGDGSHIFEHTRVMFAHDGSPAQVKTSRANVTAKHVIIATDVPMFPLPARGAYCIAEYPQTSYIVAGRTKMALKGMYISPDKGHYSILPGAAGEDDLLLIGGAGHLPGTRRSSGRYQKLADYAKQHFGVEEIEYKWKARDYLGYDDMPLIGRLYPWSKHVYMATGFMKWGITTSMVAGIILRDLILGDDNPWAEVFSPQRSSTVTSIPKVIGEKLGIR